MRKIIILIFSLPLIIGYDLNKIIKNDLSESEKVVTSPSNIHWGTKTNTLRGVTITWYSSQPDDSIRWGYSREYEYGKYAGKLSDDGNRYIYHFTFPPLKPLSHIHYSIKLATEWGGDELFSTSVDTLSPNFSFIAGSDCHGGDDDHDSNSRWQLMSELISNEDCDFYILTGDVVDDDDDWSLWNQFYQHGIQLLEKKIIFYSWGNHEWGNIALHNSVLPENKKWYSFVQGNALFISLLSEEDFDIQYQWLLEKLRNTDKEWIVVFFHRPFFTRGSHKDEMNEYRSTWWKAFDDYGVDIVLGGHTHSYIRTKPLNLNISDTSAVNEYGSKAGQGRLGFVLGGLGGRNSRPSEDWFVAKAYSGLHYIKFNINKNALHFDTYTHLGNIVDSLTIYSDIVE
jgi:predicted phosphodiesterase